MLKTDGSVPQMSLFKHKRVKGWWPFHAKNEGDEEMELTVRFPWITMVYGFTQDFLIQIVQS